MKKSQISSGYFFKTTALFHPLIGIFLFFLIITIIFYLTFVGPGKYFSELLYHFFAISAKLLKNIFLQIGISPLLVRFLINGIFLGVCSVVAFLPQTAILFFCFAVLEDSGYLAHIAMRLHYVMRPFGLSGKAITPLLMGFGCSVPAVIAASKLEKEEQYHVIHILHFLPCNARLPTLLFLISSFFERFRILILLAFSLCLISVSFLGLFFHNKINKYTPFLAYTPPIYRIPRAKQIFKETFRQLSDFLIRAFTLVFLSCVILHLFGILTPSFQITEHPSESILVLFGNALAPFFSFCALDDGRIIAALAMGFFAKESIISTICFLIPEGLSSVCSLPSAIALIVFSMTYIPCISTLCAIRHTIGIKKTMRLIAFSLMRSFAFAFILYNLMHLFFHFCSF